MPPSFPGQRTATTTRRLDASAARLLCASGGALRAVELASGRPRRSVSLGQRRRSFLSQQAQVARVGIQGAEPRARRAARADGARCETLMRWVGASVARLELSHGSPPQAERMYFTHVPTNPPPVSPCALSHHCSPMAASRARLRALLCYATCYANKLALPPSS